MSEPLLVARELSVQRGGRRALSGVSFELRAGEILALAGPNGAGKSTLLLAVMGILAAEGELAYEGADLRSMPAHLRARRIAFVPQRTLLASHLEVERVVEQGRYAHLGPLGRVGARDREVVAQAMERVDAARLAHRFFDELSEGERQRVLLARALATGARCLLLDEPTASLDIEHALRLYGLVAELAADGWAIAIVLHDLDAVARRTHRALLLADGELRAAGPSREVISSENVRAVYGVELVGEGALEFRIPEAP